MSHNFLIFPTTFLLDYLAFFEITIIFHATENFLMQVFLMFQSPIIHYHYLV